MLSNSTFKLSQIDPARRLFIDDFEKVFGPFFKGLIKAEIPFPDERDKSADGIDVLVPISEGYDTKPDNLILSTMKLAIETINLPYDKLLFYMVPVPFGGGRETMVLREFTYSIICPRPIESTLIYTDKKKYTGRVGFFNTAVKIDDINGFQPIPKTSEIFNSKGGIQLIHNLHRYRMLPQVIHFLAEAKKQAGRGGLPKTPLTDYLDKNVSKQLKKLRPLNKFKIPIRLPIRFKDDQGFCVVLAQLNKSETIIQIGDFQQNTERAFNILQSIYESLMLAPR